MTKNPEEVSISWMFQILGQYLSSHVFYRFCQIPLRQWSFRSSGGKKPKTSQQRTKFPFSLSLWPLRCVKKKNLRSAFLSLSLSLSSTDWYSALFFLAPTIAKVYLSTLLRARHLPRTHTNSYCLCAGVLAKCAHRHACREPVRSILITSSGDRHRAESLFCANTSLFARRAISRHSLFTRRRGGKAAVNCSCDSTNVFRINTSYVRIPNALQTRSTFVYQSFLMWKLHWHKCSNLRELKKMNLVGKEPWNFLLKYQKFPSF